MSRKKKVTQFGRMGYDYHVEVSKIDGEPPEFKKVISGNHYIPSVAEFMLASKKNFESKMIKLAMEKEDDSFRN